MLSSCHEHGLQRLRTSRTSYSPWGPRWWAVSGRMEEGKEKASGQTLPASGLSPSPVGRSSVYISSSIPRDLAKHRDGRLCPPACLASRTLQVAWRGLERELSRLPQTRGNWISQPIPSRSHLSASPSLRHCPGRAGSLLAHLCVPGFLPGSFPLQTSQVGSDMAIQPLTTPFDGVASPEATRQLLSLMLKAGLWQEVIRFLVLPKETGLWPQSLAPHGLWKIGRLFSWLRGHGGYGRGKQPRLLRIASSEDSA